MVVAFFALYSQIGAMVLLISPTQIELESCACTQIEEVVILRICWGFVREREICGKPDL